jgi:hypothetical protein
MTVVVSSDGPGMWHAAGELDHVVERMHPDGGERAARRFVRCGAPIVRGNELPGAGGVLRQHGNDRAEPTVF